MHDNFQLDHNGIDNNEFRKKWTIRNLRKILTLKVCIGMMIHLIPKSMDLNRSIAIQEHCSVLHGSHAIRTRRCKSKRPVHILNWRTGAICRLENESENLLRQIGSITKIQHDKTKITFLRCTAKKFITIFRRILDRVQIPATASTWQCGGLATRVNSELCLASWSGQDCLLSSKIFNGIFLKQHL